MQDTSSLPGRPVLPLRGREHPALSELVAIMATLRSEQGCPWDRQQTHETLKRYLLEETYEVLEAIDGGEPQMLREELGDLLLQIVFHCQLGAEAGEFSIDEVGRGICDKLYRRHPHVFGEERVSDAAEVLRRWERRKQQENRHRPRASRMDGIPRTLPALARACELQRRAAQAGFDWQQIDGPLAKVEEELRELAVACDRRDATGLAEEFGDLLFSLVNVARFLRVEPEDALRQAAARFERRFRAMEQWAAQEGRCIEDLPFEEQDRLWEAVKGEEATTE